MKTHFDVLDRSGKNRIIIFTIITVIAAVFAVFGIRVVHLNANSLPEVIEFDGTDFTPLFLPVKWFTIILYAVIHLVFSWLIDLAAYILFEKLALKKDSFVSNSEYILAKRVFTAILIISVVVSLYIALFNYSIYIYIVIYIYIALLMFPIWLFGYLFYIDKLKHKRQK